MKNEIQTIKGFHKMIGTYGKKNPEIFTYIGKLQDVEPGKVEDIMALLIEELEARNDGRPQPFAADDELRFAECSSKGKGIAYFNGTYFDEMDEFLALRDWMNEVIKFHTSN